MHLRILFSYGLYAALLVFAIGIGGSCYLAHNQVLDISNFEYADRAIPSRVLDDAGNELARFQIDRRDPVAFQRLPNHLIDAFVSAEDWNFFKHHGISFKGIARSVWINLINGRCAQGASTITQQLVKMIFFDSRKTFSRKIKEQLSAIILEQYYAKEQIFEAYVNNVCFGCGIYGVQAASQRFWAKDVSQLTVDEAALLAGIVRSPGRYCPLVYPLSAHRIRNVVLTSMHTRGVLDDAKYRRAISKPLDLVAMSDQAGAPHFIQMVRAYAEKLVGKRALYTQGYVIQTTLCTSMQQVATDAFKAHCSTMHTTLGTDIDGGLISIEAHTGEIKALVGGYDFNASQYNRAVQARRQIGSIVKPLLYAAALLEDLSFTDVEIDEPTEFASGSHRWAPRNYDHQFRGPMTRAYALSHSNNIVAIKTLLATGTARLVSLLKESGIVHGLHSYPSLALGCVDASLLEVVGMFNIFACNGRYIAPHSIRWIKNRWGQKIYLHQSESPACRQIIPSRVSDQVAKVLELGLIRIKPAFKDRWPACQMISKTGTTNDARTCWFAGSTPSYTTAVYIGYDDNRPMGAHVFPIHTAFPIWLSYNYAIESSQKKFSYDPSLREVFIDERTGQTVKNRYAAGAIAIVV